VGEPRPVDPERLKATAKHVFDQLSGAVTSAMIHLGDALGLYRGLAEGGPADAAGLAERTGLAERWVREWLHNQAAAGLVERDAEGRFALSPEAEVVLAREGHPAFGMGMFSQLPALLGVTERLQEAFRTGVGLPYDAFGAEGARGIERGFAPWLRHFLVPVVIGAVPGLPERLEAGALVADVGCGAGFALRTLARAFPRSEMHGYEISAHALERAEAARAEAGLGNLHFHHADEAPLPDDARYDLVLTFDCLHDMTRPREVVAAIRRAIRDDGVWIVAEIKAYESLEENLERNPMAALMYGVSVLSCLSSSLSEPEGAGLGTLGLAEARLRAMTEAAGFSRLRRLAVDHPINAFYEVRP
jgi:SAM-dependent methyltransferase